MSIERSPRRSGLLFLDLAIVIALVVLSWAFANSRLLHQRPQLVGYSSLLGLTLGTALCHWLIGVRLGGAPAWTLIPLLAIGLAMSRLLLPAEIASTGTVPLVTLALVESAVLVLVVVRLRALIHAYRLAKRAGSESFDALEMSLLEIAPQASAVVPWARLELQLWALMLVGGFWKPTPVDAPKVFTHHRESAWLGFVGVICFVLLLEGALVHWWLHASGYIIAKWVLLALHVYTFVWLIGDAQAIRIYRSSLRKLGDHWFFFLSVGLRQRARIAVSDIADVRTGCWERAGDGELLAVVQGAANVRLAFRTDVNVRPMLGAAKATRILLLQMDEPANFRAALSSLLTSDEAADATSPGLSPSALRPGQLSKPTG